MKSTFVRGFVTAAALLVAAPGQAQNLGLGVCMGPKIGLATATFSGQINRTSFFKNGLSTGAMLRYRASKSFAFQPELLYVQQGTGSGFSPSSSAPDYEVRLNYLQLPLLFKFYLGNYVNLHFGPQVGVLLAARYVGKAGSSPSSKDLDEDVSQDYSGLDAALCGGLGVDLPSGVVASARINFGFVDINSNADEAKFREVVNIGGLHNRGFEFSLGYLIGTEKK